MTTREATMLTTGERLKIARERAGVSIHDMAEGLGRHRNRITAYERSDDPPLWVLRGYVDELGNVTLEWLAAESGDPPRRVVTARYSHSPHTTSPSRRHLLTLGKVA
jgi:transcriptional regulator with XRE-family HTH domain